MPDVRQYLSLDDCIRAVEEAFRAHGEGRLHAPGVLSAHAEGGAFHIKTALVGGYFGAKANANFPSNPQDRGLPAIQGVMLLFDVSDGRPLMIADSIELTALRTAAATAVAAKYLAPNDATTATIVGCGRQGRMQLEALRRVIPLQRVFAFDTDHQRAREMDATPVTTLESRDTDIWVTCTHSRTPFLRREHVRDGAFVAAVGADNPSKSEITPELMAAARIVTDVTDQCAEIGDLHHAIAAGVVTRDDVVAELGQVVAGRTVRKSDADIVIFDSTGTGFQDTAAAALIYERARR
ncbi:MAG TPA: ornithine cyclodeaminase family protein [Thermoanaerobaculia bacterium]